MSAARKQIIHRLRNALAPDRAIARLIRVKAKGALRPASCRRRGEDAAGRVLQHPGHCREFSEVVDAQRSVAQGATGDNAEEVGKLAALSGIGAQYASSWNAQDRRAAWVSHCVRRDVSRNLARAEFKALAVEAFVMIMPRFHLFVNFFLLLKTE